MGRIEKTVFISYRRTNLPWALFIYQNLTMHGYDVFFDYLSIDSGNFEKVILDNIRARAHFLIIITPSALERCNEPGDWLRREIETAIDEKRNIVPLIVESFDFGSQYAKEALTGKIALLRDYNGLRIPADYALEAMDRLRERYLNVALNELTLPALQVEAQEITATQKEAASEATPVEKKQLTAQEWFERGYIYYQEKNYKQAMRCVNEAVSLESDNYGFYILRGVLRDEENDWNGAINDFNKMIELNRGDHALYNLRGTYWLEKRDFKRAFADFSEAIHLQPNFARTYYSRGNVQIVKGDLDEAISDYDEAIRLQPDFVLAFYARGTARGAKGDLDGAIADYDEAIRIQSDYAQAYNNRGLAHRAKGDLDKAIADYNNAIYLQPNKAEYFNNRGKARRENGDLDEAIIDFDEAICLQPEKEDFHPYLAIASISKQVGREYPIGHIEKARSFISEDDWYNRACLESVCDNFDLAFGYLQKATKGGNFDPEWALKDWDLQWLRDDPRFMDIVGLKPE